MGGDRVPTFQGGHTEVREDRRDVSVGRQKDGFFHEQQQHGQH